MPARRDDNPTSRNVFSGSNVFSGNFNAPVVAGGHVDNLTSHSSMYVAGGGSATAELLASLAELRAQVQAAQPALSRAEVVLDNLDDLLAAVQARQDGGAVEPAVARSRWEKVRSLLAGAIQITADLTQIGQGLGQLFGYG
jgi:hypothetical protein